MPTYDLELFRRLEHAAQIAAAAISSGLLGQVMEARRHEIHCRSVLGAAEMRLRAYKHGDQPLSDEDELERAREAKRERLAGTRAICHLARPSAQRSSYPDRRRAGA